MENKDNCSLIIKNVRKNVGYYKWNENNILYTLNLLKKIEKT